MKKVPDVLPCHCVPLTDFYYDDILGRRSFLLSVLPERGIVHSLHLNRGTLDLLQVNLFLTGEKQKSSLEAQWKLDTMACAPATVLALLLNYLASSKGVLSPPLNLSVELLDFKALARWLPGPGNPKETRYFLEFIDIVSLSVSPWYQTSDCTNITSTQCYLFLNQRIQTEYFVRVMAEWKEERSTWTRLPRSIQPYEYTVLSAPNLTVFAEPHSISIIFSHPVQFLTEVQMRFSVDLFQISNNAAKKHIAQNVTTRLSRFVDLPSGNYCINASAFITAGSKYNKNATICVFLHHEHKAKGKEHVIMVGVLILMCIPAAIGLILVYFYVNPISISYIPKALETDENSAQGYGYEGITGIIHPDTENKAPGPDFYSTAANMEETDEYPVQTGSPENLPSATFVQNPTDENVSFVFDKEPCYFDSWLMLSSSSEEEIDSVHSDSDLGKHYEPRPDPRMCTGW
ncbi:cytokine receptor family member B12 precursor [Silurus asotus]|uniref:Cytokine receptor family member B12 n=1 Tax=Silurus asotus TaxID=30991 RepID=A0AAD5F9Z2_SILAS|nr:cytokine receptor family member B12 precursor [Silurus asotus]